MSNGNIIKSDFVSFLDDKKSIEVIDVNDSRILNNDLDADEDDQVIKEAPVFEEGINAGGIHHKEPIKKAPIKKNTKSQTKDKKEKAEDIIENAKAEALKIVEEAKEAAEIESDAVKKKAYDDGYQLGRDEAEAYFNKEQEAFMEERQAFETEYKALVESVEPRMVELVVRLVDNLVGYTAAEKQVIDFIVRKGFEEIELAGHVTIKVSEFDYDFIVQSKNELLGNISSQTVVEFLVDYTMNKNDCIIETEAGTIDCSLDTRFRALKAELTLIHKSLMKEE